MLYTEYSKKMLRLAAIWSTVKRFKVLILCCFAVLLGIIATLIGTNGLVYDKGSFPSEVTYGEEFEYSAGAFMSSVRYEYREENAEEWTEEKPIRAGNYFVRAVSSRTGGAPSYGKEHAFKILPRNVAVSVAGSVLYGELPDVSAPLVYGDAISCDSFSYDDLGSVTTGVKANESGIHVTDSSGADVTNSYTFTPVKSDISFIKRKLEITVPDASFVYDGNPHSSKAYEVSENTPLANGDVVVEIFDKTQTEYGSAENTAEFRIFTADLKTEVTANYSVTAKIGEIKVAQRVVNITTASASKTYDGMPLLCEDYTVDASTPLVSGHSLSLELARSVVLAGEQDNVLSLKVLDEEGEDVSRNYSLVYTCGTLEVKKCAVTVETSGGTFEYDGMPHGVMGIDGISALPAGHTHSIAEDSVPTFINADTHKNNLEVAISVTNSEGESEDRTSCFDIAYNCGDIIVTRRPLSVVSTDEYFEYDGREHYNAEFVYSYGGDAAKFSLVDGHSIEVTDYTKITFVSESGKENKITVKVIDSVGNIVSDNYDIEYSFGALSVNRRPIIIETHSSGKMYDGEPLSQSGFDSRYAGELAQTTVSGVVVGDMAVAEAETVKSITDVKESCENTFTVKIYAAVYPAIPEAEPALGEERTDNYEIEYHYGMLDITKRPIYVRTATHVWEYDGEPHSDGRFDLYFSGVFIDGAVVTDAPYPALVSGHRAYATYDAPKVTYADLGFRGNNIFEIAICDSDDNLKTDNYSISYDYGSVAVAPRSLKVYTDSERFEYDAEPHSHGVIERVEYDPTGFNRVLTDYGWVTDGYTGFEQADPSPKALIGDDRAVVENGTLTFAEDVGKSDNAFQCHIENSEGERSYNYALAYSHGTLEIYARKIKVTTSSRTFLYDGNAHSAVGDGEFEAVYNGETEGETRALVGGQYAAPLSTAYITDAGTCKNDFTVGIYIGGTLDFAGVRIDKSKNYEIEYALGTLEVKPRPVYFDTVGYTWEYNGTARKNESATSRLDPECDKEDYYNMTWLATGLVGGHEFVFYAADSSVITDAGSTPNVLTVSDITDADGKSVWENYTVKTGERGTLSVDPRAIYVTTDGHKWIYDGREHTESGCEAVYAGSVEGETDAFVLDHKAIIDGGQSSVRNVGHTENRFAVTVVGYGGETLTSDGNPIADNYDIKGYTYGSLEIVARPIVFIGATNRTFEYDGDSKFDEGFESRFDVSALPVDGINASEIDTSFGFAPSDTVTVITHTEITDAGTTDNVLGFDVTYDGEDMRGNYIISTEWGELEVKPRPIRVYIEGHSWVYDGEEHTHEGYRVDYFGERENQESAFVKDHTSEIDRDEKIKSITDVGKTFNGFKIKIVGTLQSNYEISYAFNGSSYLEVTKRPVTVSTLDDTFEYDSAPHYSDNTVVTYNGDYEADKTVAGGLVKNHETVTVEKESSFVRYVSDSGTDNRVVVRIVDESGNDKTDNYDISYGTRGKLYLTPRKVSITTASGKWVYDGVSHSDGTAVIGMDGLAEKDKYICASTLPEREDVGTTENSFVVKFADKDDATDRTENYEVVSCDYGTLEIVARPVRIQTDSKTWEYDGTAHSHRAIAGSSIDSARLAEILGLTEAADTSFGVASSHEIEATAGTEITFVGKEDNELTVKITANGKDVTSNYDIKFDLGTLEVTPRPLNLTTYDVEFEYYDREYSLSDAEIFDYFSLSYAGGVGAALTPSSHIIEITDRTRETEAGNYKNVIRLKIVDSDGNDVGFNYDIKENFGNFIIHKRKVTVVLATESFEYDGEPHSATKTPTVQYSGDSEEYETPIVGHTFVFDNFSTATDALKHPIDYRNSVKNTCTATVENADGKDVSDNYDIEYDDSGYLIIIPRSITVSTDSATFVYDGKEHSLFGASAVYHNDTKLALVEGHELVSSSELPTVKNVSDGKVSNEFTVKIMSGGTDVTHNYSIKYGTFGTLEVVARPIKATSEDGEWEYDGKAHSDSDALAEYDTAYYDGLGYIGDGGEALVGGDKLAFTEFTEITEIGSVPNVLKGAYVVGNDGNYVITNVSNEGTLTVRQIELDVTTPTNVWYYDGEVHFDTNIVYNESKLLSGHSVAIVEYATITDVGEKLNEITVRIKDANGADVSAYYSIAYSEGLLTIREEEPQPDPPAPQPPSPDDPPLVEAQPFIRVTPDDYAGRVYLREESYGDFDGYKWSTAPAYAGTLGGVSMNNLVSLILKAQGYSSNMLTIEYLENVRGYGLPYYLADEGSYRRQTSDTYYSGIKTAPYTAAFYDYTFTSDNGAAIKNNLPAEYAKAEEEYRAFVYANYLNVKDSTAAFFEENYAGKFNPGDINVIAKVASFIQGSARYNLDYAENLRNGVSLEDASVTDRVAAFLGTYKEGVCRHYAEAATMLYRWLGIPARYVSGIMLEVTPYPATENDNTAIAGHAWVEVYIDGCGWVQVEVTGDSEPPEPPEPEKEVEVLLPCISERYNGKPLVFDTSDEENCWYFTMTDGLEVVLDFRYELGIVGGVTPYQIKAELDARGEKWYKVYTSGGADITDEYAVVLTVDEDSDGYVLELTYGSIEIKARNKEAVYSGSPIKPDTDGYDVSGLPEGCTLDVTLSGSRTETGDAQIIVDDVKVYDANGRDVTDYFSIRKLPGTLTVRDE